MFKKYSHIHFVGIGGIGMSGIAQVLINLGYAVSGSDLAANDVTDRLSKLGSTIYKGHLQRHIGGADVVVVSSAVSKDNPEVVAARKKGIPIVPRAEMLAELMRLKYSVVVSGTHGKTTTTSMTASILADGGLDPTMVVGGKLNSLKSNARLGKSDIMVAEADESDRSFLKLTPTIAIITNIDPEHMESYRDFDHVLSAYTDFANKVPFYGAVVACVDNANVRAILPLIDRRIITYAIDRDADFTADRIEYNMNNLSFDVSHRRQKLGRVELHMPGRHNIANALAAIASAIEMGVSFDVARDAIKRFSGIEKRFQILNSGSHPIVVNDYAHHPTEIAAVIRAAREGWPKASILVVHQPHRYTRLQSLMNEFADALGKADEVVLTPIFAASERPLAGVHAKALAQIMKKKQPNVPVTCVATNARVIDAVTAVLRDRPADMVMFLGAGSISGMGKEFVEKMEC